MEKKIIISEGGDKDVNEYVADYMDSLIEAQEEKLRSGGYYLDTSDSGSVGELNKYYAVRSAPITQEECQRLQDSIRKMDIPEPNKSTLLANIEASMRIGAGVQVASSFQSIDEVHYEKNAIYFTDCGITSGYKQFSCR